MLGSVRLCKQNPVGPHRLFLTQCIHMFLIKYHAHKLHACKCSAPSYSNLLSLQIIHARFRVQWRMLRGHTFISRYDLAALKMRCSHQLDAVDAAWVQEAAICERLGTKDGDELRKGQADGLPLAIFRVKAPAMHDIITIMA